MTGHNYTKLLRSSGRQSAYMQRFKKGWCIIGVESRLVVSADRATLV